MILGDLLTRVMGDSEFVTAMERGARAFQEYRAQLPFIPYAYTRTLLMATPRYELVAMQWAPGSVSPLHDHGESRCWVLMAEGALHVDNFEREDDGSSPVARVRPAEQLVIGAGDLDHRLGARELHRVKNAGDVSAYSIQLYAAPIATYSVIDESTWQCRTVVATHDLRLDLDSL